MLWGLRWSSANLSYPQSLFYKKTHNFSDLLDVFRLKDDQSADELVIFRSGPLGDLKVSGSYFVPMMTGTAEQEYLIYRVDAPISVRRGQSAMVPLIDSVLDYEQLVVYNGAKMPNHPLLVWRFQNATGVALEQGPVSISMDGQYLGDGLVRFAGVGDEIQVPYALEFGILVSMDSETDPFQYLSVEFDSAKRVAVVQRYQITRSIYQLQSRTSEAMNILIERRNPRRGEFYEMPEPIYDQLDHKRWAVAVLANAAAEFTVQEREIFKGEEDVSRWSEARIEELREAGVLEDQPYDLLRRLTTLKHEADQAVEESKALQAEYAQIVTRQEQLRKNLAALGESQREVNIRNQILDDLEASENRRRAIEKALAEFEREGKERAETQRTVLDELYS